MPLSLIEALCFLGFKLASEAAPGSHRSEPSANQDQICAHSIILLLEVFPGQALQPKAPIHFTVVFVATRQVSPLKASEAMLPVESFQPGKVGPKKLPPPGPTPSEVLEEVPVAPSE